MYVIWEATLWSVDAADKPMARIQEPLAEKRRLLLEESITLVCCFSLVQGLLWNRIHCEQKKHKKKTSARRSETCAIMIKSLGHYSSACKDLRGYHTAEINSTTARPVPPLLPPLSAQPLFTQAVQSRAVAPRLDLAVLDEVTKDGWWRGRLAVVVPPNQRQN